jgi:hypothetical protein
VLDAPGALAAASCPRAPHESAAPRAGGGPGARRARGRSGRPRWRRIRRALRHARWPRVAPEATSRTSVPRRTQGFPFAQARPTCMIRGATRSSKDARVSEGPRLALEGLGVLGSAVGRDEADPALEDRGPPALLLRPEERRAPPLRHPDDGRRPVAERQRLRDPTEPQRVPPPCNGGVPTAAGPGRPPVLRSHADVSGGSHFGEVADREHLARRRRIRLARAHPAQHHPLCEAGRPGPGPAAPGRADVREPRRTSPPPTQPPVPSPRHAAGAGP